MILTYVFWDIFLPLAVGTLVLAAFGGGKLLDIAIPTLVPLFSTPGLGSFMLRTNGLTQGR